MIMTYLQIIIIIRDGFLAFAGAGPKRQERAATPKCSNGKTYLCLSVFYINDVAASWRSDSERGSFSSRRNHSRQPNECFSILRYSPDDRRREKRRSTKDSSMKIRIRLASRVETIGLVMNKLASAIAASPGNKLHN